jgi:hypothetical protein
LTPQRTEKPKTAAAITPETFTLERSYDASPERFGLRHATGCPGVDKQSDRVNGPMELEHVPFEAQFCDGAVECGESTDRTNGDRSYS